MQQTLFQGLTPQPGPKKCPAAPKKSRRVSVDFPRNRVIVDRALARACSLTLKTENGGGPDACRKMAQGTQTSLIWRVWRWKILQFVHTFPCAISAFTFLLSAFCCQLSPPRLRLMTVKNFFYFYPQSHTIDCKPLQARLLSAIHAPETPGSSASGSVSKVLQKESGSW